MTVRIRDLIENKTITLDTVVLGTLPMTADGCILGNWATPFVRLINEQIERGTTRTITFAWTPADHGQKENMAYAGNMCYSTDSAARSAAEKGASDAR